MYRGNAVGVVVPAYNEEGFVGEVIESMPTFVDRVYAVDDASTDGTWAEIRQHAGSAHRPGEAGEADVGGDRDGSAAGRTDGGEGIAASRSPGRRQSGDERRDGAGTTGSETAGADRAESAGGADGIDAGTDPDGAVVVPVQHDRNRGVGGAIKTGYRHALADGMDVTAVMGGDGQMDPDRLDEVLDPVVEGRAGYAKANRLVRPEWRAEMPRFRLVGNVVLAALTKVASGYWEIGDPQNGYTAISRSALEAIDLDAMFEFYGYCNDLLVRLNVAGVRVADVPVPPSYGDEESHISYPEYVPKVSWMLLRTFCWRLWTRYVVRDFHPLVVCYGSGVLAGLLGVASALRGALDRDGDGARAVVLLSLGVLQVALAMVLDRAENDDRCVQEQE